MPMNKRPNQTTFASEIGELRVKVPETLSSKARSRHIHKPATRVIASMGARVALSERGEKRVASIRFLANMAIVVSKHNVVVRVIIPVSCALDANSATVALLDRKSVV